MACTCLRGIVSVIDDWDTGAAHSQDCPEYPWKGTNVDIGRERWIGKTHDPKHDHCWHQYRGPILMVIPDGHTIQNCCKCPETRTIHIDHAR